MSQAEDLLTMLSETVPEHVHTVTDTDNYFIIDPVTRIITNPIGRPLILMQRDHKSTVYTFQLPQYIDGHDMSLCNRVKCHFNNLETTINEEDSSETIIEHPDLIELTDLRVNPNDENSVICSWIITRQATWYSGALGFFLQYLCVDNEGNETYEWHTDSFTDIIVNPTKHNDEAAIIEYTAIFEQWRERIFGAGDSVKNELIALTEEKLAAVTAAGTTQVESVNSTGTAQVEAIANEGLRVFNTIPEDYSAMSEQVGKLSKFAGPVIRQEAEGVSIAVTDSAKMPLLGLQMFGKSKQFTTTGRNLLDVDKNLNFTYILDIPVNIPAGTYKITYSAVTFDGTYPPYIRFYDNDTGATIYASRNECDITLTKDETRVCIYSNNYSASGSMNVAASITQLMISVDGGEYEPYTGGQASPNPEYPQEIESAGDDGIINAFVVGKNLLRDINTPPTSTHNGIICEYEGDGVFHIYGTYNPVSDAIQLSTSDISLPINLYSSYTLTAMLLEGSIPDGVNYHPYIGLKSDTIEHKNWIALRMSSDTKPGDIVSSTMIPKHYLSDATAIDRFWLYSYNPSLSAYTADFRIQVWFEENTETTPYEEYTEQQLVSEITLPGLPVSSGGNYTDENGQQYIVDYRDWERGVDVQHINTYVVTGEENWKESIQQPSSDGHIRYDSGTQYNQPGAACMDILCTHFEFKGSNLVSGSGAWVLDGNQYLSIRFMTKHQTVDELKAMLAEKYASGNPVIIQYALLNPIETPIPEAELQAYRALRTNYPNTMILNDSGAHMKLAYGTDTKMYIDKKFEELQAAILANS